MHATTLERLRSDIEELTVYPDRRVGSEGHAAARVWVEHRMLRLGLEPFAGPSLVMPYTVGAKRFANVIGVVQGADVDRDAEELLPVVLGAHYDTVPGTPGADDNAASVAVVLEVAARLMRNQPRRPVVIAVFDAEEPPYFHSPAMGSTRFVADHIREYVHAAIILDLIAHAVPLPGLENLIALMGAESHVALADLARDAADGPLPLVTVPNAVMPDMSDHYAFRVAGRPFLFVGAGHGPHYHQATDTLDTLDLHKTVLVTDLVESLVRRVAETPLDGARPHDSGDLDFELLQRTIGEQALSGLGVRSSRDAFSGLTQFVWMLQDARSR